MYKVEKNKFKGDRCFIVGTGSSLDNVDLSPLKNEITISLNLILLKEDFVPNYLCIADTTVMENHYDIIFNDKMNNGFYVISNGCLISDKYPDGHGNCHNRSGATCRGIHLDSKYENIHIVKHNEKSGININHMENREKLLKTDEWYIDEELKTISSYGGSTIDNLTIPLAVYLGFKKIYLLGCDGGWNHFYDSHKKDGKRDWINYRHVIKKLDKLGISLVNCDSTNAFEELEYIKYEDIVSEENN